MSYFDIESDTSFWRKHPSYWSQIKEFLTTFVKSFPLEILNVILHIVAFQSDNLPESVLPLLVKQLANTSAEHKSTIEQIEHLLVNSIKKDLCSLAIKLLESILAVGVKFISLDYFLGNYCVNIKNYAITSLRSGFYRENYHFVIQSQVQLYDVNE